MASRFAPSASFIKSIKSDANYNQKIKIIDKILKELEFVEYFHNKCPEKLTDRDWKKLIRTKTIAERVSMLEYMAITQKREAIAAAKKENLKREVEERFNQQKAAFESGGMGYGPNMYQLLMNPLRNEKKLNLLEGARHYKTRRLSDLPKIGIDCQYFPKMTVREYSKMGSQLMYVLNENDVSNKNPFHLEFLNLNVNKPEMQDLISNNLGFMTKQYSHQTIPHDVYDNMPYTGKEIFYVTKKARKFLEKPLGSYNKIILPATFDMNDDTLKYCKKMRFTPVYLPVRKYIKWQSGHFYLPLPNILRIFREVSINGGDWGSAINNNVAHRHKLTIEERRQKLGPRYDMKYHELQEKRELIKMITDATEKEENETN